MTYAARDTSVQEGQPFELYEFTQGAQTWRYSGGPIDITWGGHTWMAAPIARTEINQSNDIAKDGITLTFPRDDSFAAGFLAYSPETVTTLTLRRGHSTDPDAEMIVYWKGRVVTAKAEGSRVTLECESVFTSLRRPGLRARYQRMCRHPLYGRGCWVDKSLYATAGTVAAISGATVTVVAAASQPDGWWNAGMLADAGGTVRFIVGHLGQVLTLARPLESLTVDASVTLYPGCNHAKTTCIEKFDNLLNFGGFPYIPLRNPLDGASII